MLLADLERNLLGGGDFVDLQAGCSSRRVLGIVQEVGVSDRKYLELKGCRALGVGEGWHKSTRHRT